MDSFGYILESGAWSLGGLIVGFFIGRAERNLKHLKQMVEDKIGDE